MAIRSMERRVLKLLVPIPANLTVQYQLTEKDGANFVPSTKPRNNLRR